jgi:hypothetical protein
MGAISQNSAAITRYKGGNDVIMSDERMILRPIDFSILYELTKGRNVAGNIHIEIDSARAYVNERTTVLNDYGLIRRVGPNENVGLYEITDEGRRALEFRTLYEEDKERFEDIVEGKIEVEDCNHTDGAEGANS